MKLSAVLLPLALAFLSCRGDPQNDAPTVVPAGSVVSRDSVASYASVVKQVSPAVVTIRSERRVRAPRMFPFFFSDPFSRVDPRRSTPPEAIQRGLGSGVIVTPNGQCLTNHHVVDGAQEITVELISGRRYQAKLLGSDPPSDLALLRIDGDDFPVLALGDSDAVQVGDVALAIGNPLGVGQTVTMGIISAKNRATGIGEGSFEDFLQTDAPINQGNSGGALINTAGHLIGINSQIVSMSGGNIGIGFAIPINMARSVMEQLAKSGEVRRGLLGVGIQPLTPELASSLGLSGREGILVNSVSPGSPAERAGLRRGDVIVALNGDKISDANALRNRIAGAGPGTDVTLTFVRDGKEQQVRVKLAEYEAPRAAARDAPGDNQSGAPSARLGLSVQPLSPELAARLNLPTKEGLIVVQVVPGGPADGAGLLQGDILLEANRKPLRSPDDLRAAIGNNASDPIALLVNRRGQTFYVAL